MTDTTTPRTTQVGTQLDRLGLSSLTSLHDLAQQPPAHLGLDERTTVVFKYLADFAYTALVRLDSAERQADAALQRLGEYTADELRDARDGGFRTAVGVQQQTDLYAEALRAIAEHVTAFNTVALPLAHLLGRKLG